MVNTSFKDISTIYIPFFRTPNYYSEKNYANASAVTWLVRNILLVFSGRILL